jgi:hypothetical protein
MAPPSYSTFAISCTAVVTVPPSPPPLVRVAVVVGMLGHAYIGSVAGVVGVVGNAYTSAPTCADPKRVVTVTVTLSPASEAFLSPAIGAAYNTTAGLSTGSW